MLSSMREFFGGNPPSLEEEVDRLKKCQFETQLNQLKDRLKPVFKDNPTQSHDERSLRRFLVAAGSVDSAYTDILHCNRWRQEMGVDLLSAADPDILEQLAIGYVHSLRARDAQGRPIFYVVVRKHIANNRDLEKVVKFTVYMLELTLKRMDERVNDTLCLVFDLHRFSLANMDYQFVKRLVWLLTKSYPERLGVCLIYNAPVVFQGCWPIIRRWLHEETANKVVFVNNKETMGQYLDVDLLPPQDM